MALPPFPNFQSFSLVPADTPNLPPQSNRTSHAYRQFLFRRNGRRLRLVSFPLALLLLYFLFPFHHRLNQPGHFPPPTYLSHAGKSALESTIVLPTLQHKFPNNEGADVERRQKVKESIKQTWELYVQEAWGWDEVAPVRGGGRDTRLILKNRRLIH